MVLQVQLLPNYFDGTYFYFVLCIIFIQIVSVQDNDAKSDSYRNSNNIKPIIQYVTRILNTWSINANKMYNS